MTDRDRAITAIDAMRQRADDADRELWSIAKHQPPGFALLRAADDVRVLADAAEALARLVDAWDALFDYGPMWDAALKDARAALAKITEVA